MLKIIFFALFLQLVKSRDIPAQTCPQITYVFPPYNETNDYVRYYRYFPEMKEVTTCLWVETRACDYPPDANTTWWSYGLLNESKAYTFSLINDSIVVEFIMGNEKKNDLSYVLPVFDRFHFCHSFSTRTQKAHAYFDGELAYTYDYTGPLLEGGGALYLGNIQLDFDNPDSFVEQRAFVGNMTNFTIWPRVLTSYEIERIFYQCQCPVDYVVFPSLDKVERRGYVDYDYPHFCPIAPLDSDVQCDFDLPCDFDGPCDIPR